MLQELKQDIATSTKILAKHGLIAPFGHVSARVPGEDAICILADSHSKGKNNLGETSVDDVVVIDFDGNVIEGSRSAPGERFIHTGVYRARPDVQSVVHAHPFACIGMGIAGKSIPPVWNQGTMFAEGVPIFEEAVQIETAELGDRVAKVLAGCRALLLKGHGIVNVGASPRETCVDAYSLERTAQLLAMSAVFGEPRPIPREELTEELFTQGITARGYYGAMWDHLQRTL